MTLDRLYTKHRLAVTVAAAAVLAFSATFGLVWSAGFAAIAERLGDVNWVWIPLALAAEVLSVVGYVLAYREVARAEGGTELKLSRAAALVVTGFGVFVPTGGFVLDEAALRVTGLSRKQARERVLGLGALEYVVLAPVAMIAALYVVLGSRDRLDDVLTFPWIVGVPVGFAAAAVALPALRGRLGRRTGWRTHLHHVLEGLGLVWSMARKPRAYGLAFLGVAVYWAGDILCLWTALHVFMAGRPSFALLVIGYATGYALTRRTLPLGGAGLVDALLPLSLGWVGIALAPAVLAVLVYRFMNLWLPIVPALLGLPTLKRLAGRREVRAPA
jgi:uncharacterized membrane protein YbhN (UPF0104 family)